MQEWTSTEAEGRPSYTWVDACPLCGSRDYGVIRSETHTFRAEDPFFGRYLKDKVNLRRCSLCGFAFVDKVPADPEFYRRYYSYGFQYEFEFQNNSKQRIFDVAKSQVLRYVDGGKLLDVGASNGALMKTFSSHFQVKGVEINVGPAQFARSVGLDVELVTFAEARLPDEHYDAITFVDVLEHLPKPQENLQKARRLLRMGGLIYIKVPNYSAQIRKQNLLNRLGISKVGMMADYSHINHFCPSSLANYLRRNGFEVLEAGFTGAELHMLRPTDSIARKARLIMANLVRESISGSLNALSRLTGSELGFNFYVLARKVE